jgi:hypothetical protein
VLDLYKEISQLDCPECKAVCQVFTGCNANTGTLKTIENNTKWQCGDCKHEFPDEATATHHTNRAKVFASRWRGDRLGIGDLINALKNSIENGELSIEGLPTPEEFMRKMGGGSHGH